MPTEVKLELKKPLINYDKKPVKNTDFVVDMQKQYPTLTKAQLTEKCPDMTFGYILPHVLLQVPTQNSVEQMKLFRWASKIEDKMITDKGELTLDINQITELHEYVEKVQSHNIIIIAPILIYLEELKEQLKT